MLRSKRKAAFTLIELLVVVAIIALLLSILLPALGSAREQGKKAKCLANLKNLGFSMHQYASDDPVEQLIPISLPMMYRQTQLGPTVDNGRWLWRCAMWFTYGGRSSQKVFKVAASGGYALSNRDPCDPSGGTCVVRPDYDAERRALNVYMSVGSEEGDRKRMEWFSCPGDTGYPIDPDPSFGSDGHGLVDDAPDANALRPMYETVGNSYRASLANFADAVGSANTDAQGFFAIGPWGHRASTLPDMSKLVLAGEPTFFNMIGVDSSPGITPEVLLIGWHKRKLVDNLLFCDGSARSTKAERQLEATEEGFPDVYSVDLIHRATTYRLDVYPTPGARIWGNSWSVNYPPDKWPFKNYQDNLRK